MNILLHYTNYTKMWLVMH